MQKIVAVLSLLVASVNTVAQTQNFPTLKEAKEATKNGYKTKSGWVIREGDRINIGKPATGEKRFAYIYNAPGLALDLSKTPMERNWSGKSATVRNITYNGSKRSGFSVILVINVAMMVNYWVEIDNAIEDEEILIPAEFAKNKEKSPSTGGSVADELKKLKELLDAGAITQAEYDDQKKKLLD
ncbi:SHOCT domain-containing protein [Chitinophaga horti]|uniref:SHOCT domain-containing protein n=1 Tax=Chitinophaga horti TaxID=2920382 RepID=A0ABY6J2Z8_9BACT|nr:SHOCT domain-containing protein [Chitinophaga horti]UYQ94017.1 SHOCT domain-containing protein [Chitinophaga horti]